MKQHSDLVVPIRDRRQSRRLLTTRNVLGTSLVAIAIFAAVTVRSEMGRKGGEDYGRLFGKQVSRQEELAKPTYDVVKEAPVADQNQTDPMLITSAAREQLLIDNTSTSPVSTTTVVTPVAAANATPIAVTKGEGVTIVGGSEGVTITQGTQRRPTLSGGIFKP